MADGLGLMPGRRRIGASIGGGPLKLGRKGLRGFCLHASVLDSLPFVRSMRVPWYDNMLIQGSFLGPHRVICRERGQW